MIEDIALMLFLLISGVPILIGGLWALLTRQDKYYYKSTYGGRWKKIPVRRDDRGKD